MAGVSISQQFEMRLCIFQKKTFIFIAETKTTFTNNTALPTLILILWHLALLQSILSKLRLMAYRPNSSWHCALKPPRECNGTLAIKAQQALLLIRSERHLNLCLK